MTDTNPTTPDVLAHSARLLKALADPIRLRLLNLLFDNGREVCVCHLHEALRLPQPTVSRHLAYLRKHGLVTTRRDEQWVYYRLARPAGDMHCALLGLIPLADPEQGVRDRRCLNQAISCCGGP